MSQYPFHSVGNPFPNNQRTVNAMIEGAKKANNPPKPQKAVGRTRLDPSVIYVRNDSGSDIERYGVIGLADAAITSGTNEQQFLSQVYMSGGTPQIGTHDNKFAIALEGIPDGEVGRCAIHGVVQCKVTINNSSHIFCDITDNDLTKLSSGIAGNARILWTAGASGDQWSLIHLGDGVRIYEPFVVDLAQDGGAQGNQSSANTYTYSLTDPKTSITFETTLDPTASPHNWSREIGTVTTATKGTAYLAPNAGLTAIETVLHWMDEEYTAGACS